MARIDPLPENDAPDDIRSAFARHRSQYNARITNMKATLAHSLPAFEVYMEWYRLYERIGIILALPIATLLNATGDNVSGLLTERLLRTKRPLLKQGPVTKND